MLVERIAEAPEVRAAITQQGAGLITDVGRRLTLITEALDDALELVVHRLLRRAGHEAETDEAGLAHAGAGRRRRPRPDQRRLLAGVGPARVRAAVRVRPGAASCRWRAAITVGVLGFLLGGGILVAFWALVGQTPGMRFLSIRLDCDGDERDRRPPGDPAAVRRAARGRCRPASASSRSSSPPPAAAGTTTSPGRASSTTARAGSAPHSQKIVQ